MGKNSVNPSIRPKKRALSSSKFCIGKNLTFIKILIFLMHFDEFINE